MLDRLTERFQERLFADVLKNGGIKPAFQPIVDLKSSKISSFEVLARWEDEEFGIVSPTIFIPLVEQFGMLTLMTDHLIRSSCRSAAEWPGTFRLTFNVSPTQFQNPDLASIIARAAGESGFSTERLQVEITESAFMDDPAGVRETVERLKELGMRIILDDFGTGFSSLTRLQALPFDKIKIDASFVRTMTTARDSRKIVSSVIGLGHSLGLSVVAEGIETQHQLKILRQLGCDFGQGYLLGRPSPTADIPAILDYWGQQPHDPSPLDLSCSQRLAELDSLYRHAPIALCFLDRDARLLSANQRFGDMFEIDPSASVGMSMLDLFPAEASFIRAGVEAILAGRPSQPHTLPLRRGRKTGLATVAAVKDEGSDITGVSLVIVEPAAFAGPTVTQGPDRVRYTKDQEPKTLPGWC